MHSNDDFRWKGDNIYLRLTFFRILLSMNSFSEFIMYNLTKDRIIRCRIARSSYLKLDRDRIFGVSFEFDSRSNINITFKVFEWG